MSSTTEEVQQPKKSKRTTEEKNEYMKDYMKTRYRLKPDVKKAHKLLMNTRYVNAKYEISPQVKEKYKNYLFHHLCFLEGR